MSKKMWVLAVVATSIVGPFTYNAVGYYDDQQLKRYSTQECEAFGQISAPTSKFGFRRYKQEDKKAFYALRDSCEASIQHK